MATSNDYPGLRFIQAAGYTPGRRLGPPLWIVWHTMEASEFSGRALSTALYFADPGDGRQVSAHWCADDVEVIQCVDEDDTAWTVGNVPGNYRGLNMELSGRARQTRAEWLDPFGRQMFARCAPVVAHSMKRWGIPNAWRSQADLRDMRPGHTTHYDLGVVFGGTDHTDPGPAFPRDHVLAVVDQALEGDIMTVQAITPEAWDDAVRQDGVVDTPWDKDNAQKSLSETLRYLLETAREGRLWRKRADDALDQLAAQIAAVGTDVDAIGAVQQQILALLAQPGGPVDLDALTTQVNRLTAAVTAGGAALAAAAGETGPD